jgi:hypothetical protein
MLLSNLFDSFQNLGGWNEKLVVALIIALVVMRMSGHKVTTTITPLDGARKIFDEAKALHSQPHEWADADPGNFSADRAELYTRLEGEMRALGFTTLGNIENLTLSRIFPRMRTYIRAMVSKDRETIAGIFVIGDLCVVEFETELSDGTFFVTNNTEGKDFSSAVEGIERKSLPPTTPVEDLLALHRRRTTQHREVRPGLDAVRCESLADCIATQQRVQAIKSRAAAAHGYVDLDQFDRCADSTEASLEVVEATRAELERLMELEQMEQNETAQVRA